MEFNIFHTREVVENSRDHLKFHERRVWISAEYDGFYEFSFFRQAVSEEFHHLGEETIQLQGRVGVAEFSDLRLIFWVKNLAPNEFPDRRENCGKAIQSVRVLVEEVVHDDQ